MMRLSRWIATRFIADWERVQDPYVRSRYGALEGWVSVVGNLVLAGLKAVLGVSLNSAGLIADALHSLSDMASSVVVIISFRVSRKPPDPEHPFGHAKVEYVATLVVALLMVMAGFQIGQESLLTLLRPPTAAAPLTLDLLAVLVVLMVAKEAMAGFSRGLGRMIGSSTLEADGWHHRTDALSTAVVIVGLAGRNVGWFWLDGAAGLLVGVWIVYTGFRMALNTVSPLLGESAPETVIDEMRALARAVPGVVSIHDLTVHQYGHFYFTTVHAEVSDRHDAHKMHEIAVQVETRLLKRFPGECVVHIDPVNLHHPLLNRVADVLKDVVVARPELVEFRDLNLWSDGERECGDVEISVDHDTPPEAYEPLAGHIAAEVHRSFPALELSVRLKVDFSAQPLSH